MVVSNLEKYRSDLDSLIEEAENVQLSLTYSSIGHQPFLDSLMKQSTINLSTAENYVKTIKPFSTSYQHWYSEALPLVKQLLPDRANDFIRLYEKPKTRKKVDYESYRIEDACQGLRTTFGGSVVADSTAAIPLLNQQVAIIEAIKRRFESSLFDIKQLVQADLFDSELEGSRELLKNNYIRAAGAVAGVVLEGHLKQVCDNHSLPRKTNAISGLADTLKAANIVDPHQFRHIQLLADIRNDCSHKNKKEPTAEAIEDLINGTNKIIKTIF